MTKILVVEDEVRLAEDLTELLRAAGYETGRVADFDDTAGEIIKSGADLVLLDINLPRLNGEQVLRRVRERTSVPVIMLTSRDSEVDEVMSMSFGADDFVRKPYSPQVLLLRIEAVLSRVRGVPDVVSVGALEIVPAKSVVRASYGEVLLSKNELAILMHLAKNRGKIVSRMDLIDHLWDDDRFVDDNTLTVNINRLRQKLDELGCGELVQTRRGQGYILDEIS